MNGLDFIILGLITLSAAIGLVRGFVKEALSLIVWLSAFVVASRYYVKFSTYFSSIESGLFRNGIAIALLFMITLVIGAIVNCIIGHLVQKTGLSGTNRVIGLMFGFFRGVLIVSAILFFMDVFGIGTGTIWWKSSELVPELNRVIMLFFDYFQVTSSFLSGTI
ncbi:colicin V production protein [Candidatus Photodesmus blepharus]|uniref:Colicin V production protein n=1 Tax=Candidatus Photodesmus blepharonis TaxID=1179155 RepID=A0A084CNC2_9GAMM|nr:CvpA family protein [Candidatus Photodesmus blepharus]KEY91301.1 colicin V production protein [Candidatus Photodesmus blepharus]